MSNHEQPPKPENEEEVVHTSAENNEPRKEWAALKERAEIQGQQDKQNENRVRESLNAQTEGPAQPSAEVAPTEGAESGEKNPPVLKNKLTLWQKFKNGAKSFGNGAKSFGIGASKASRGLGAGILVWLSQGVRYIYNYFTGPGGGGGGGSSHTSSSSHH